MPTISMSARLYLERRYPAGKFTRRMPGFRASIGENLISQIPMHAPHPIPEALHENNDHPPDARLTKPWPHGAEEQA